VQTFDVPIKESSGDASVDSLSAPQFDLKKI
jgi:hypothetical protein